MTNLIQKAKQVDITTLYEGQLRQSGKCLVGKCIFHKDDNPSLALYKDTNSFFCFSGCGGGDVIKFFMKLHDCDFKTAIKELTK